MLKKEILTCREIGFIIKYNLDKQSKVRKIFTIRLKLFYSIRMKAGKDFLETVYVLVLGSKCNHTIIRIVYIFCWILPHCVLGRIPNIGFLVINMFFLSFLVSRIGSLPNL